MIAWRSSSICKECIAFPWLLYCDSRCSQNCCQHSQTCQWHFHLLAGLIWTLPDLSLVLSGAIKVLSGASWWSHTYHNPCYSMPVPVIIASSDSAGQQKCPPRVWYSPAIDIFKFALHILSDNPGDFQRLKYILLVCLSVQECSLNCYDTIFNYHN